MAPVIDVFVQILLAHLPISSCRLNSQQSFLHTRQVLSANFYDDNGRCLLEGRRDAKTSIGFRV